MQIVLFCEFISIYCRCPVKGKKQLEIYLAFQVSTLCCNVSSISKYYWSNSYNDCLGGKSKEIILEWQKYNITATLISAHVPLFVTKLRVVIDEMHRWRVLIVSLSFCFGNCMNKEHIFLLINFHQNSKNMFMLILEFCER